MNSNINQFTQTMITKRVRGGYREDESRSLLSDLIRRLSKQNLPSALVYNGFATESAAQQFVELLASSS